MSRQIFENMIQNAQWSLAHCQRCCLIAQQVIWPMTSTAAAELLGPNFEGVAKLDKLLGENRDR